MGVVAFDNTMLSILLNPNCRVPIDPTTQSALTHYQERAKGLLRDLQKKRWKVILPAPALAELLTAIGPEAGQYVDLVSRSSVFQVAAFDTRCAIELASINRNYFQKGIKKGGKEPYQKIKIDRQILAICKVNGCSAIYTDDINLAKKFTDAGLEAIHTWDLAIPEGDKQLRFRLERSEELPDSADIEAREAPPA